MYMEELTAYRRKHCGKERVHKRGEETKSREEEGGRKGL